MLSHMFEPGHRALRKGRACQPGGIYLITFTTAGRNPLFRDSALAMVACGALDSASNAEDAASVCWVLMPDHFHALVQLGEATSLTRWVQRLKALQGNVIGPFPLRIASGRRRFTITRCARKKMYWQRRVMFLNNPVRAGLVDDLMSYPYWNASWL